MVTMQDAIRLAAQVRIELAEASEQLNISLEDMGLQDLDTDALDFLRRAGAVD